MINELKDKQKYTLTHMKKLSLTWGGNSKFLEKVFGDPIIAIANMRIIGK